MFLVVAVAALGLMVLVGAARLLLVGGQGAEAKTGAGAARTVFIAEAPVQLRQFSNRIEVLGVAKARQSVTLTADATELLLKIYFRSGDHVRQGQVLAQLNAREQNANIGQEEAALALADQNLKRYQTLADKGIAAKATVDQYKAAYDQAKATLDAARSRAADRVIRAPFSGVVGLTDAAPGMLVNPGASIATLDDLSLIRVDFPVPERFLPVLREGLPISATADAYPAQAFHGVVAKLDTRIDPSTHALTARAEFLNGDRRLRPGMLLHVTIDQGERTTASVPEAAVVFEADGAWVLTVKPDPAKGAVAVKRVIKTGERRDGLVEVTSGLVPGEMVVADGLNRVRPNDAVTTQVPKGPASGRGH